MLDQFLAKKNMATGDAPNKVDPATARIFKPPAMVNPGIYLKPIPFGGMGDPVNGRTMQWALGAAHNTSDWEAHKAYRVRIEAEGPFRPHRDARSM